MHKLVRAIESHDPRERTAATLTLLKLCNSRLSSNPAYLADRQIRPDHSGFLLTEQRLGHLYEAVGAGGDLAVSSVCVKDVFEAAR